MIEKSIAETTNVPFVLYKAAHDMRSQLMSVKGLVYLIQMDRSDEQQLKYFTLMEKSLARLDAVVNQIVSDAKKETNQPSIELVSLYQIAHDTWDLLRFMDGAMDMAFLFRQDEQGTLSCNEEDVNTIFCNMVSNAIRYRDKNRQSFLEIVVSFTEFGATIKFIDNGVGIDPSDKNLIFDKFYTANKHENGTGLGLHLVKKAVEQLGGEISVTSRLGFGTTFEIKIPSRFPVLER